MDPSTGLQLRPAVAAEHMELEGLQWRASLALPEYRDVLMAHLDAIELPLDHIEAGQVCVADHDGAPLGFSVVLLREDGAIELDGLFVEPGCWRMGVGRTLVEAAAKAAQAAGADWLHVVANPLALGFYKACGFELTVKRRPIGTPYRHRTGTPLALRFAVARRRSAEPLAERSA